MSLYTTSWRLTRLVADTALVQAQEAVCEALGVIYDATDWSFQKGYAGWLAPGVIFNTGTTTTTPYSNLIIGDATTTNLIVNYTGQPFLTQLQYRNPGYSVYNIIGVGSYNTVAYLNILTPGSAQTPGTYVYPILDIGPGTGGSVSITVGLNGQVTIPPVVLNQGSGYVAPYVGFAQGGTPATFACILSATLTLDRPWLEPTQGPGQPYMIYQVYFVTPVKAFRKFVEIRDVTNDQYIDFWSVTQADLAVEDPQRQDFSNPRYAVPAGFDQRPGSATLGWPLYELWPHQGNYVPYSFSYRQRGPLPEQTSDYMNMSAPAPITDKMVEWKAREILLNDAASRMESKAPGSGKGMMLLAALAAKQYETRYSEVLSIDLNLDGESRTDVRRQNRGPWNQGGPFVTLSGGVNLGGYRSGSDS